jgi:hypothetical protein
MHEPHKGRTQFDFRALPSLAFLVAIDRDNGPEANEAWHVDDSSTSIVILNYFWQQEHFQTHMSPRTTSYIGKN